jgi:hypothetical protein
MSGALQQVVKLRAWWSHRQGLNSARQAISPAAVLTQFGWARSVGGCGPYLTLFSRAGISRAAADHALAALEIHELPSARGCTYVLPAEDFPLGLCLAQNSGDGEMRVAAKLGVTAKEIDKLCQAVLAAIEKQPLDPDGIRQVTGNAARSLGAEGQKKGLSSTLPVALGQLQKSGLIRRVPTNGRLDQQRYQYTLWRPNPLHTAAFDPPQAAIALAHRFFRWIAPASASDFQAFAGIGVKAAKAALEPLKLRPISKDSDLLLLPSDRDAFESFIPPKDPCYHLVANLDSFLLLRRGLSSLLDPKDASHPLLPPGPLTIIDSPVVLDRGRIVGLWEYDPAGESIAHVTFIKQDSLLKQALATTGQYIRSQLGDARTFSLDSPKSRAPRIAALRKAQLAAGMGHA